MTLIYLDAIGEDGKPVQFSFYADFLDVLRKSSKLIAQISKKFPKYTLGEMTFEKGKCKEIRIGKLSV